MTLDFRLRDFYELWVRSAGQTLSTLDAVPNNIIFGIDEVTK